MFYSQDDEASLSNTPRDIDFKAGGGSPMRKKRPPSMFKMFGQGRSSSNSNSCNYEENQPPSLFNMMSQDSVASQSQVSQFSQDFTDRMGNMVLYSNADGGAMSNLGCQFDGNMNSQPLNCGNSNEAVAPDCLDGGTNDAFSIPHFRGEGESKKYAPSMTQLSEGSQSQSQNSQPGSGFKLKRPSAFDCKSFVEGWLHLLPVTCTLTPADHSLTHLHTSLI